MTYITDLYSIRPPLPLCFSPFPLPTHPHVQPAPRISILAYHLYFHPSILPYPIHPHPAHPAPGHLPHLWPCHPPAIGQSPLHNLGGGRPSPSGLHDSAVRYLCDRTIVVDATVRCRLPVWRSFPRLRILFLPILSSVPISYIILLLYVIPPLSHPTPIENVCPPKIPRSPSSHHLLPSLSRSRLLVKSGPAPIGQLHYSRDIPSPVRLPSTS